MLLFCVSYYDVHDAVIQPPARGITYHGDDVSCINYADDTTLLATSVRDLRDMLNNIHNYGRKWRIKY